MAGNHLMQTAFNSGEWSPLLDGRIDLAKYGNSLLRLESFLIDPRGPAVLRPGWYFKARTKDSAKRSALVPFEFSVTQAYMLEFGDGYIRFYRNQAQITVEYAAWLTATGYALGDLVTQGGNHYRCLIAHTSGTFATDLAAGKWIATAGSTDLAYEIPSPYQEEDLSGAAILKSCQSADVLYLFHPSYAPRKLSRTGHTAWTLTTINFKPPALSEQGIMPAATLTLAAVSGDGVLFTAGSGIFLSGDVGRVIVSGAGRASITGYNSATQVTCDIIDAFASVGPIASQGWSLQGSPNGNIVPSAKEPEGSIITLTGSDGATTFTNLLGDSQDYWVVSGAGVNEYYLINTAPGYGTSKPPGVYINGALIQEGVLGSLGISQWAWGNNDTLGYNTIYIRMADGSDPDDSGSNPSYVKKSDAEANNSLFRSADVGKYIRIHGGLVKITLFTSSTTVSGEILKALTAVEATKNWTLESDVWTEDNGYPSCGTFYEERLVLAGSSAYPETIWGSVVGDYENFTPGTDDSDAFEFTLSGRQVNVIRWLEPREYLIVGTVGGEWRIGPEDTGVSLTPLNVVAKQERNYGSANITPATAAGSTLFVQRAGRKVREFTYQWEQNGYTAPDLTLLAEHITEGKLAGIVYQQEPLSILWGWTESGEIVALTYLRDQDVVGWHRHPTAGECESMAVIPGDGYDEVWAIFKRTVNGADVRNVEMLGKLFGDTAAEYTANKGLNAFFVDSGITYNGVATTTIPVAHLEGETVAVLADGKALANKTVTDGVVTLGAEASVVHVGLPFTAVIQTQRLESALSNGTSQGRTKKIHDITLRVHRSGSFKAGRDENNLDACFDRERDLTLGAPYPLFTGDIRLGFDGNWDKEGRLMIVQDKPLPLTVVAVVSEVSIS